MNPSVFADRIVIEARSWIGTPYRHQASLKGVGCDCLGLVRGVWRAVLGNEPEEPGSYQPGWAEPPGSERLLSAAQRHLIEVPLDLRQRGDVLLFRWRNHLSAKHLGIMSDPDMMIHAHDGACVAEVALGLWRTKLVKAFRFPMPETPGG